MKTIKQVLIEKLVNNGLWPKEAEEVMDMVVASQANKAMQGRWNDSPEDYPPDIMGMAWRIARDNALEWIDKNKPMHFARGIIETA